MGFQSQRPTHVSLLSANIKLYATPGPVNTDIGLLMTGNMLPGLTSLVSNCIEWMDMYEYGDILLNPWILHVSRGLFKASRGSVMMWGMYSWSDMEPLIHLDR